MTDETLRDAESSMSSPRSDRRSFLANGGRVSAAAVVASLPSVGRRAPAARLDDQTTADPAGAGPSSAPRRLTVNGMERAVGVDPDELFFAWELVDARRGARQNGYRIVVSRTGPAGTAPTVWDSGHVGSARQAFVAYGGRPLRADSTYRWRVAVRGPGRQWSAFSAPASFTTGLRTGDWRARWLQPGHSDRQPDRHTYVRTERRVAPKKVARATAFVAAAHKYQLWINGSEVDSGPSFCYPDEQYYQATDITAHVRPGAGNVIGVLHHWYGAGQGRPESAPGLLVQVAIHFTDGATQIIGSDGSWREHPGEWMAGGYRNTDGNDFVENIDGRAAPVGWAAAGFDDRGWTAPVVIGAVGTAPFTALVAQRTRVVEESVAPVSVTTLAGGAVVVDFGRVYAGRPEVSFRHGTDGRTVPMHVGYLLDDDGHVSTVHGTQGTDLSFSYVERQGSQTFVPFTFLGFRYLQIDDPGEPIGPSRVRLRARHSAMPGVAAATLVSSNTMVNKVWALCARSALYTSQEQFIDTPTREKGPFLWDGATESQVVMRAFGEQNLTWQGLRDFARSQKRYWPDGRVNAVYPNGDGARDFPTFTALYPEWVWRYYLNTGDRPTLETLWPTLENISGYLHSHVDAASGLITGLALGSNGDPIYGYDLDTVADTTVNVMAVNAFTRIGLVAKVVGQSAQAATHAGRAAALATAVNGRLTRTDGVYVDGLRADGSLSAHASQQVNAAALAYAVVPAARVPAVGSYVAGLGISVSPDHGLELVRALAATGGNVVSLLSDSRIPGWAHIVTAGGTFTWETWTPSDLIGDSMSHGWGSGALVAMQESILGVMPVAPDATSGATVLDVRPCPVGMAVSGVVPTVSGTATVAWHRQGTSTELALVLPPNASARVHLPAARPAAVTEGGKALARAAGVSLIGSQGGLVSLAVAAGSYHFTAAPG